MVLDAFLLNTQPYKVRIKGKVEKSQKGIAPSPTPRYSSCWKGNLRVRLDYGRQLYFIYETEAAWTCKCQIITKLLTRLRNILISLKESYAVILCAKHCKMNTIREETLPSINLTRQMSTTQIVLQSNKAKITWSYDKRRIFDWNLFASKCNKGTAKLSEHFNPASKLQTCLEWFPTQ